MTAHDDARWAALRREAQAGVVGGPGDGAGFADRDTRTWDLSCSCAHGTSGYSVVVASFLDLLAGMNVLGFKHEAAFRCGCSESDEAIARTAVDAWRAAFGDDPIIPNLGSGT